MKKRIGIVILSIAVLGMFSCEKEGGNETNISKNSGNESHNSGQNCMQCHVNGGEGKGWFNVAGTVYDANQTAVNPNGTVYLYTGSNGTGTLKATVEVDSKGNFYTTEKVDFGSGLYPAVKGSSGTIKYMGQTTSTGACNSCHGSSQGKIWVD